jgi:heterodisulfide reductase subunit B2
MKYSFFPGCCKHATGKPYYISTQALCDKLGIELKELPDWNCCGSTSYFSVRELESFGISARNLAIAQEQGDMDLVAICSACYTVLAKTNRYFADDPVLHEEINEALAAAGRHYEGDVKVRHLLDVMVNDLGYDVIKEKVTRDLDGLKVACYYGCQLTRPMGSFDDPEFPTTMDKLVEALGGAPVDYPVKTKCCGGMLMLTKEEAALRLCYELLKSARESEAQVIITACPLCQMNVEAYQPMVNKAYATDFAMPVMYFTQLTGIALGVGTRDLALDRPIVAVDAVLSAVPA